MYVNINYNYVSYHEGWETMMEVDTTSDDYWPFPSKEFTLLYFLLNSPRPLVYDYVFMRTYTFSSNVIFSHL